MEQRDYDLIVIGTGPGGEGAAMKAAKARVCVAAIERYITVGGGCTHWGTIPSKALRHQISRISEFNDNPLMAGVQVQPDYPKIVRAAAGVINRQVHMRETFYSRNQVRTIEGQACFVDPHTITISDPNDLGGANTATITADKFIIATGSRPYRPQDIDFAHPRIYDANTILDKLDFTPRSITIYGAGVVGCEYASMFRGLNMKVNLINNRSELLSFLDEEIIDAISYHLRDQGVIIRHNEEYERVEGLSDSVVLHLKSGKQIKSDVILWAAGRTANAENMGLEDIGIELDGRGRVARINENFQTELPHIYAVGDVIGPPGLASASYDQGRFAAEHAVTGECDYRLVADIPTGIYTTPEISSIGKTERELTEEKVPYEIGHSQFKSLARAQIRNVTVGMLKILFHRETLQILGIHCFGAHAAEIIHIGQAIMSQKGDANTLEYFVNTTFNYPTMAEAYRVAALNGLNRLF